MGKPTVLAPHASVQVTRRLWEAPCRGWGVCAAAGVMSSIAAQEAQIKKLSEDVERLERERVLGADSLRKSQACAK
jgi:hypothetical protein